MATYNVRETTNCILDIDENKIEKLTDTYSNLMSLWEISLDLHLKSFRLFGYTYVSYLVFYKRSSAFQLNRMNGSIWRSLLVIKNAYIHSEVVLTNSIMMYTLKALSDSSLFQGFTLTCINCSYVIRCARIYLNLKKMVLLLWSIKQLGGCPILINEMNKTPQASLLYRSDTTSHGECMSTTLDL